MEYPNTNLPDKYEAIGHLITALATRSKSLKDHPTELMALIRHFDQVRVLYDRLNEAKKFYNEIHDHLSRELIPEAMRAAGVKTITVDGVGRVTVSHRYSCSMIDKDLAIEWLRSNGYGSLVQETVNSSTLAATSKSMLQDEGKELPSKLFKINTSPYTSVTKV